MTAERWLPIPGFVGWYEISENGNVRSLDRTLIRRNGSRYPVRGRLRRISTDRDARRYVALCTGQRGRRFTIYPDRLAAELFGNETRSAA
jgi:hypothetical protein